MKGICPRHGIVEAMNVRHYRFTEDEDDWRCILCAEPVPVDHKGIPDVRCYCKDCETGREKELEEITEHDILERF